MLNIMKSKSFIASLLLGLGTVSQGQAGQNYCDRGDVKQIEAAVIAYIENDSKGASEGVTFKSERCLSPYASLIVHYKQPDFDDQVGYLQNTNGEWKVLGLATGFDGDFIETIPESLRQ